jgi:hypothetical protein
MAKYMAIVDHTASFLLGGLFTRKRLSENAKEALPVITVDSLHTYSAHLKSSVETYFKLSTPDRSDYSATEKILLERLGRLRGYSASPSC